MAQRRIKAKAFVDATLKTKAPLTFIDEATGERTTEDFTVVYYAFSPKRAQEVEAWAAEFDRRGAALEDRRRAHDEEQAQLRLKADAESQPFTETPFTDPEEAELQHGMAQFLARVIHSLPEIVGEDDKPVEITADTLAGFAAQNLRSLRDAIQKDSATDPTLPGS